MAEYVVRHVAHIFRNHVAAALQESTRTACQSQVDARTRTAAETNITLHFRHLVRFWSTRCENDVGDVLLDALINVNFLDDFACVENLIQTDNGLNLFRVMLVQMAANDLLFFLQRRIVNDYFQHKAVYLRFG